VIAEDYADAREVLRILLGRAGHDVYEAHDGPDAVEVIGATDPDIAFIDVGLPGFDGYEVARRVRASPRRKHVLLVAVTGYAQLEDRAEARAAGFDLHLEKPIDVERVLAVVAAAC
jgi:CheY-like chemotaxis protein